MAVSRGFSKKAPSQKPNDFFACKQHGGTHGHPAEKIPDVLPSGKMREEVMGRKNLSKQ